MTLDEFLDVYVPTVLKPMGKWAVDYTDGWVRRGATCPLTAEARCLPLNFTRTGQALGLSLDDCYLIGKVADNEGPEDLRVRLLAGLGLTESK
jgi:hypothetical protein